MKNITLLLITIVVIIGGIFFFANTNKSTQTNTNKIQVATSFYPLYFFASEIGKEKVEVTNLTAGGVEPHDFEPTAQDIARIQQGKLLIINGAGLEPWVEKLRDEFTKNKVTIVDATEGLPLQEGTDEHEEEATKDPHVWLNPVLAKSQVDIITKQFVNTDQTNKAFYEANARELKQKLDALDTTFKTGLQACSKKDFITSHTAFAYLAQAYGINQVAISGISPEEEPSTQQLAEVTNFAKENNVKYIFFETLVSPELSETLAKEVGAQTLVLDPLEGISDDDSKQGKNYFSVMEDNLKNLQIALECNT